MEKIPLIVVAGPTASGKTKLGVEICRTFGGEVISADSMQIYRGMDIATAKPTEAEMQNIPHHLISIIPPEEKFSVAKFTCLAKKCIDDIKSRDRIPVIVGGTGLYIDSLVDNITLCESECDEKIRASLIERAKSEGAAALLEEVRRIDPEYAACLHENNEKRIIRALELWYSSGITMSEQIKSSRQNESPYEPLYFVLDFNDRDILYDRINTRVDMMVKDGLIEEAEKFRKLQSPTSAQAIGYKELEPYFAGEKTLEEALDSLKAATRHYAKRQLTWFRRRSQAIHIYVDCFNSCEEMYTEVFKIIRNSGTVKGD